METIYQLKAVRGAVLMQSPSFKHVKDRRDFLAARGTRTKMYKVTTLVETEEIEDEAAMVS